MRLIVDTGQAIYPWMVRVTSDLFDALYQQELAMRRNLLAEGYEPERVERIIATARELLYRHLRSEPIDTERGLEDERRH